MEHDDAMPFRTVVTIEIPIQHRFAVGDKIYRQEKPVPCDIPDDEQRSVWRIIDVGCSPPIHETGSIATWDGPWYRMEPVNEIARMITMEAHGRVAKASTPLIELMGPVTERVGTVDRQCEPHAR
jgi:hypothetical protein